MPTLESTNVSATTLYEQVNQNVFLMPHFQRKFRWKLKTKRAFVDSLFRGVFCGAMLHISNNEDLALSSRTVSMAVHDTEEHYDGDLNANHQQVLDGQQRICTFSEIFCNMHKNYGWYIDIEKLASPSWETDPEDHSYVVFSQGEKPPYRARHKNSKDEGVLIRADQIFSDKMEVAKRVHRWFNTHADRLFGEDFETTPPSERTFKVQEKALEAGVRVIQRFDDLRRYNFTVGHLDKSSPIEEILLNFVRINNEGLKLALFELAVPRYLKWINLYTAWKEALCNYPVLRASLTKTGKNNHGLGWTALVTCTMAMNGGAALRKSSVFTLDGEELAETWPKAIKAMATAYAWGRDNLGCFHREMIPVHAPFVGLAAALVVEPAFFEKVDELQLKQWFYSKLYRGAPPTYQEWRSCFLSLVRPAQTGEPLNIPPMTVSAQTLLKIGDGYRGGADSKPRARARTIQCFAHAEGDLRDLKTGSLIREEVLKKRFALNRFHIYPKSKANTLPFSPDKTINIIVSTKRTNDAVKTNDPTAYLYDFLEKLKKDHQGSALSMFGNDNPNPMDEMNDRLRSCFLLPPDGSFVSMEGMQSYFAPQNMETVMKNRALLIYNRLKQVMGSHLRDEDENVEDWELENEGNYDKELSEEEEDNEESDNNEFDETFFGLLSS